ncbi:branched-chain amino acid aminotransferase [Tindallia magadiensis]|uniref:Branched-chain amino acid aminotransferase n=1 Tax=Tindallia magadiensis TaxID=69895 RepID=A0A1I3C8F7_9FIRM|nr:aminotransferase class IV [Tindallia magadiensis]SFH70850.1 branched-chain amino acid aminotransferase [Tindallia magadiensis]
MQREIEKDFFLRNGFAYSTDQFDPEKVIITPSVYEVIRVINGIPLFWEAHLDRMQQSLSLLGYDISLEPARIHAQLHQLIQKNHVSDHNIKVLMNHLDEEQPTLYLFFITSYYPSKRQLEQGVPVIRIAAERENPKAKVIATKFREPIQKAIREAGVYEALLINGADEITEGSRSNFFVVKNGQFYTSPSQKVLEGVTRKTVLSLLDRLGYPCIEQPISQKLIESADGLFLTGTSPGVLPISQVDQQAFPSAHVKEIQEIQGLYHHFVKTYIAINGPSHTGY